MKIKPRCRNIFALALILFLFLGIKARANEVENAFVKAGLIDVNSLDETIKVDLVNSDPKKNYFRENFYDGLNKAYLRRDVAVMLSNAQHLLKNAYPNYSLRVLDAARPRSVSQKMFDKMKGTRFESYAADPAKGSMHNYGIAVDITIEDADGNELDMGFSPFYESRMEIYWQVAKMKLGFGLSDTQRKNRRLLSATMKKAGFLPLRHEWWHFNGMPKHEARNKYTIIE